MKQFLLFSILLLLKPSAEAQNSQDLQKFGSRVDYTHQKVKKMILKDGSIAWIHFMPKNRGENLEFFYYPNSVKIRTSLKLGDVLFEVAEDTLTLYCDPLKIISPGNSFHITATKNKIAITPLYQHLLLFEKGGECITIQEGETIKYRKKKSTFSIKRTTKTMRREIIQGTEYELKFKRAPVRTIANKLEKKYDKKIYVRAPLDEMQLTIDLTDTTLHESIEIISAFLSADYKIENNIIQIK